MDRINWKQPNKWYTNERLTPDLVRAAEERFGGSMPSGYLQLLSEQNGGSIAQVQHPRADGDLDHLYGLGYKAELSVLNHDWQPSIDYLEEKGVTVVRIEKLLPLCGDGHWFVCLDYRELQSCSAPSVVHLDVELGLQPIVVSTDFDAFLRELESD